MTKQTKQTAIAPSNDFDVTKFKTKSEAIRYLASTGMKRADIARSFTPNLLYQHVRNVLTQPLKKSN